MRAGEKRVDPTHPEHLAPRGVYEPLVREAIQNSLDATVKGKPTQVKLCLGELDPQKCTWLFESLRPHLAAVSKTLPEGVPLPTSPVRYLAVEDYNTRGLVGDPRPTETAHEDPDNYFFRFWHSVGQSSGESKRRGSWGVGKVVFSNASDIRTFFGLTRRAGDDQPLLMGESVLSIHSLPGGRDVFAWYGQFASHEKLDGELLPLPICNAEVVDQFTRMFDAERSSPGLSIVIPYIRQEVTIDLLAASAIDQYLLPIVAGRLEVTLQSAGKEISLTSHSIEAAIEQIADSQRRHFPKDELISLVKLARWHVGRSEVDYVHLPVVLMDQDYRLDKEKLSDSSTAFFDGKPIAVTMPVQVLPKGSPPVEEVVRVVLQRDENLKKGNVRHLRSGIELSTLRDYGGPNVRGFLIVGSDNADQGQLDKLLQASEGPAHLTWAQSGNGLVRAKAGFENPGKTIGFLKNATKRIIEHLSDPSDERDFRTLAPFFPDLSGEAASPGGSPGENQKKSRGKKTSDKDVSVPKGTIAGTVRSFVGSTTGLQPVENASVTLSKDGCSIASLLTGSDGCFSFRECVPGDYVVEAAKSDLGQVSGRAALGPEAGVHVELVLRPEPAPRMFSQSPLADGVAIRGNPKYRGDLRPIRVRFAYAAWGGVKKHDEADFSLAEAEHSIVLQGVREEARELVVKSPNQIEFTPSAPDFCVEVRGFDRRRGLYVDIRTFESNASEQEEEEVDE